MWFKQYRRGRGRHLAGLGAALCAATTAAAWGADDGPQKPISAAGARDGGGMRRGGNPFTRDYHRHVGELLDKWHVPGVAVGIVDGDDIWTEGFGIATLPSTPVTPSTLFYCASTSKAFTAAALSIMIASGNYTNPSARRQGAAPPPLAWDTPVHDLIPDDFVLADPWATAHVTLEDALSHRTGLPRHDKASPRRVPADSSPRGPRRDATVRDVTRALRHLPLSASPRTTWQYCNHMFVAASHAIETLAGGRWLGDALREWVWAPLGMRSTYFSLADALAAPEHLAGGYAWDGARGEFVSVPFMPVGEVGGAGAVMSTVEDYARWVRSLLREDGPVPPAGHQAVKTPRSIVRPASALPSSEGPYDAPELYALGWIVASYRGHRFWTHSGGMHAYGAEVFFFPDLDFGVVALGNTAGTSNFVELLLVWELVDGRLGVPEGQRYNWTASFERSQKHAQAKLASAIDRYYPDRPEPAIPPALPLEAYAGTYFHPGYLDFTLELAANGSSSSSSRRPTNRAGASLTADRPDATWPSHNEFEHVSGEYWMIFMSSLDGSGALTGEYAPAQFRVGADGRAEALGVTWLSSDLDGEDVVEGLVWFERID